MFKFATNKFNGASANHHSTTNAKSLSLDTQTTNNESTQQTAAAASRRRQLVQKELFAFNRIADKGFPSKPSAMDYDKKLKLLAIGTKNGDIRVYGAPGTNQQQLSCYQDVHPFPILRILFIQGQNQLITLSERVHRNDATNKGESHLFLVLWQIPHSYDEPQSNLVHKIKEYQLEPKIINGSRLSAITLLNDNSHLFLGFETGDVYVFNVASFQLVPGVINKDFILKNLLEPTQPNIKKLTQLGAVESICHHPRQLTKLLIAYQRGLWIIFDFIKNQIDQTNQTSQQLESAVFYQAGECVATSHSDGSFILWDLESSQHSKTIPTSCTSSSTPNIVYGPFPCKAVTKCLVKTCKNDQPFVIFSGGCPRINYSDKITISVIQGENLHVCFDFTSKIIDYFTIDKPTIERQSFDSQQQIITYDNPQALFVLLEEEFVAIDLCTEGCPQYKLPYLYSVHSSAIICTHYVNNVSLKFYDKLKLVGNLAQDQNEIYSDKEWPISSLNQTQQSPTKQQQFKDLLLTGHEDGSIRFWDVTQMSMTLIYKLKTSDYFQTDSNSNPIDDSIDNTNNELNGDNDNWPPFRKVGTFDPYSDDPKLGIQKIYLCAQRELLVLAGTAGQVLVMNLNEQQRELPQITPFKINLIGSSPEVESCFVWKGHEPLTTRSTSMKLLPGYQLHSLIQLYPPATVSALSLSTDWQLVAMGTSHGFALFDYLTMKPLLIRCTLDPAVLLQQQQNPNDSGSYNHNTGTTISRRKSLKKSLRESFRKLRRGRSQKQPTNKNRATMINTTNQMRVEHIDDDEGQHKPIERQVESREFKPMDDIPPSVIRYMYFVRTFITNSQQLTNSLWVGTNTGIIYIYALQFNTAQLGTKSISLTMLRTNQAINCLLAKEMRLKHRAPVVNIQVIDQHMQPLPLQQNDSDSIQQNNSLTESHKVIICSEEQFKVFQLPTLKPVCKFKLTAVEGARVRRIGYNSYTSKSDPKYQEHCLSCLSNLGDLSVYSLPQLKRQVQIQCMKQQDINAITSFVFSKQGQAFYLQSPSEFVHISMSARDSPAILDSKQQAKSSNSLNNKQLTKQLVAKPKQEIPIASPSSPPPPIPAPRTTLPKEDLIVPVTRKSIDNSKTKQPIEETIKPVEQQSSEPIEPLKTSLSPTKEEQQTIKEELNSPKKQQIQEIINTSVTTTTSGTSHLSSLDQSSMSTNTNTNLAALILNNNNNNSSMLTMTNQSDSFNVSSSGYNGSMSCVGGMSSFMGGNVDMSMDSVVDKFNDDYNDVSSRKIPPAINESVDSLLNESNPLDRLCLNGKHQANGHTNSTFDCESDSKPKLVKQNGKTNGYTNGSHLNEDDDIDLAPQKSSSPLIKTNGTNGTVNCTNSSSRVNKIEQVTKRIENGNKLEYRETAID